MRYLTALLIFLMAGCGKLSESNTQGPPGNNGSNGTPGVSAPPTDFTPVGIEDPCGDAPDIYDEVFLRLANGTLLASFSDDANGDNTRFSILDPGTYTTTDGDNCTFTVTSSYAIINESHHY